MASTKFSKYFPKKGKHHIYRAKPTANYDDERAQLIGERLEELEAQGVTITPQYIVDNERTNPESPFFGLFDDGDTAAVKWWLAQARNHLNQLEIVVIDRKTEEETTVRATMNVAVSVPAAADVDDNDDSWRDGLQRGYVTTPTVVKNDAMLEFALRDIARAIRSFVRKYEEFTALANGETPDSLKTLFNAAKNALVDIDE